MYKDNKTPLSDLVSENIFIKLSSKSGDRWLAAKLSEEVSTLILSAFGWDSAEAASAYKEVTIRRICISSSFKTYFINLLIYLTLFLKGWTSLYSCF